MKPYNERLPLIDEQISQRKGELNYRYIFQNEYVTYASDEVPRDPTLEILCTRIEFYERKAELHNLYEWGVHTYEYTFEDFLATKGLIEFCKLCAEQDGFDWQDTLEKRPEQKEQDMNNDWYDKGELPPVGTVCEYHHYKFGWKPVEIIGFHIGRAVFAVWDMPEDYADYAYMASDLKSLFRPLPTENDKLVEQMYDDAGGEYDLDTATKTTNQRLLTACRLLHEQGYRKIKPMGEGEFVQSALKSFQTKRFEVSQLKLVCESLRKLHEAGCRFIDKE